MTTLKNKFYENKCINISILIFMIQEHQKVLDNFLRKKLKLQLKS